MKGCWTPTRPPQVRDAVAAGKSLDDALRAANGVPEDKILRSLAAYFDVPFVDLEKDGAKLRAVARNSSAKFPARILLDRRLMPLAENGDGVADRHLADFRHLRARRTAPGDRAGRSSGPRPVDRNRPVHQEISRRRRRHAPVDGHRRR